MPDSISNDSVPQIPGATASNPFPKMTKEDKIRFVIKDKRKFPKKIFLVFFILLLAAASIAYVLNKNQKSKYANVNDAENPQISITQPQNGDSLKGQSNVVVFVADNTINQKAYKGSVSDLKVTPAQLQTVTINVADDLKKATSAQLLYETNGITSKDQCQIALTGATKESCGPSFNTSESDTQKQTYNFEASKLKTGDNIFEFTATKDFSLKSATLAIIFGDVSQSGKVIKVEFLLDEKVIGEKTDFTLPFSFNTSKYQNGAHVLLAKAYDEAGNTSVSAPRTVTFQN